jgi:hypothetical protein
LSVRENDARRRTGTAVGDDLGATCEAERAEILRLDQAAGRSDDVSAAGLQGFEETFRENLKQLNRFYPARPSSGRN